MSLAAGMPAPPGGFMALILALISVYVIYLLLSQKAAVVFSPEYKAIISRTPHVRYKTSIVVWILLGIFILFILLGIIGGMVAAMRAR
jgi:hypothetical protein